MTQLLYVYNHAYPLATWKMQIIPVYKRKIVCNMVSVSYGPMDFGRLYSVKCEEISPSNNTDGTSDGQTDSDADHSMTNTMAQPMDKPMAMMMAQLIAHLMVNPMVLRRHYY